MQNKYFLFMTCFYAMNMFAGQYPLDNRPVMVVFNNPIARPDLEMIQLSGINQRKSVRGETVLKAFKQTFKEYDIVINESDIVFYWAGFIKLNPKKTVQECLKNVALESFVNESNTGRKIFPAFFLTDFKTKDIKKEIEFKSEKTICEQEVTKVPVVVICDDGTIVVPPHFVKKVSHVVTDKDSSGGMGGIAKIGLLFGGCLFVFLLYRFCSKS
jgi:hypothetical protein